MIDIPVALTLHLQCGFCRRIFCLKYTYFPLNFSRRGGEEDIDFFRAAKQRVSTAVSVLIHISMFRSAGGTLTAYLLKLKLSFAESSPAGESLQDRERSDGNFNAEKVRIGSSEQASQAKLPRIRFYYGQNFHITVRIIKIRIICDSISNVIM